MRQKLRDEGVAIDVAGSFLKEALIAFVGISGILAGTGSETDLLRKRRGFRGADAESVRQSLDRVAGPCQLVDGPMGRCATDSSVL